MDDGGAEGSRRKSVRASRFRGITWYKKSKKWKAQITIAGKFKHLGYFETEEQAARAFDREARRHGRATNFKDPLPGEEDLYGSEGDAGSVSDGLGRGRTSSYDDTSEGDNVGGNSSADPGDEDEDDVRDEHEVPSFPHSSTRRRISPMVSPRSRKRKIQQGQQVREDDNSNNPPGERFDVLLLLDAATTMARSLSGLSEASSTGEPSLKNATASPRAISSSSKLHEASPYVSPLVSPIGSPRPQHEVEVALVLGRSLSEGSPRAQPRSASLQPPPPPPPLPHERTASSSSYSASSASSASSSSSSSSPFFKISVSAACSPPQSPPPSKKPWNELPAKTSPPTPKAGSPKQKFSPDSLLCNSAPPSPVHEAAREINLGTDGHLNSPHHGVSQVAVVEGRVYATFDHSPTVEVN